MSPSLNTVCEAFELLFHSLHRSDFRKTRSLHGCGERDLLPLVRAYLLGYFGHVVPEATVRLPGSPGGTGRVDFTLKDIAVEFAVRKPLGSRASLSPAVNETEIKKLVKYNGLALLVLFDFSKAPYTRDELDGYRVLPSFGKGPHYKFPFNLAYFYRKTHRPLELDLMRKNIRGD